MNLFCLIGRGDFLMVIRFVEEDVVGWDGRGRDGGIVFWVW